MPFGFRLAACSCFHELRGREGKAEDRKPSHGGSNPPVTAVFHMASNHSFIQGGVSTLPSFFDVRAQKNPDVIGDV